MHFVLEFGTETETTFELSIYPLDTPLGSRWAELLTDRIHNAQIKRTQFRFHGLPSVRRTDLWYCVELMRCAATMNAHVPGMVPITAHDFPAEFNSDFTNYLHTFFITAHLDSQGSLLPEFNSAPAWYKQAVQDLNATIHAWENEVSMRLKDTPANKHHSIRFFLEYLPYVRLPLNPEDYASFTTTRTHGTVYLKYCQTGRNLAELYANQDEVCELHDIRPQRWLSADCTFWLGDTTVGVDPTVVNQWIAENADLFSLGIVPNDPMNALGEAAVATISYTQPIAEVAAAISANPYIRSVRIES